MNCEILVTSYFSVDARRLKKKYKSFADDLRAFRKSLNDNPLQGVELSPGIRKIRFSIKSKGKGKSGGARVITYNLLVTEENSKIYLLLIYDKEEASTVKIDVVKRLVKDLGL